MKSAIITSESNAHPKLVGLNVFAGLLVLVCAFSVIQSSHACRQLYAQLQVLEASKWHMEEDFGRLLLEQSTLASHHRVEQVATRELGMQPPTIADIKVFIP